MVAPAFTPLLSDTSLCLSQLSPTIFETRDRETKRMRDRDRENETMRGRQIDRRTVHLYDLARLMLLL